MTPKRWLLTILSFAAAIAASGWVVWSSWPAGHGRLTLPLAAHLVALSGALGEVTLRAFKLTWSAKALDIPLSVATAFRVCLGGDFGALYEETNESSVNAGSEFPTLKALICPPMPSIRGDSRWHRQFG